MWNEARPCKYQINECIKLRRWKKVYVFGTNKYVLKGVTGDGKDLDCKK